MRRFSIKHNGQEEVQSLIHRLRSYRLVRNLLIGFILVAICNLLFSSLFYTPKMFRLADERRALKLKYEILENRIASAQRQLEQIRHRDNFVYRPLFSSDTLSIDGVYDRYADSKYASLEGNDYSPVMKRMWQQMDQLARSLYLESKSMDELQILSEDKERFSTSVPAIWPIDRSKFAIRSALSATATTPCCVAGSSIAAWICPAAWAIRSMLRAMAWWSMSSAVERDMAMVLRFLSITAMATRRAMRT